MSLFSVDIWVSEFWSGSGDFTRLVCLQPFTLCLLQFRQVYLLKLVKDMTLIWLAHLWNYSFDEIYIKWMEFAWEYSSDNVISLLIGQVLQNVATFASISVRSMVRMRNIRDIARSHRHRHRHLVCLLSDLRSDAHCLHFGFVLCLSFISVYCPFVNT